ncbi:MAG: hypothetical protein MZV63_56945 [Marinilabiliales bacterium]|nr:hypothetical protein [Marinilabiliales bacterium]
MCRKQSPRRPSGCSPIKDDAMSVIMIVPKGSVVEILGLDSLYFNVRFEGSEGFVKSDGLDLDSEIGGDICGEPFRAAQ